VYDDKGNIRLDAAGQPITTSKIGFTVRDLIFGEESEKHIAEEIAGGIRPINWNVKTHPDYAVWGEMLKARQALQFDPSKPTFGFAKVKPASGAAVSSNFAVPQTPVMPDMATLIAQAVAAQMAAAHVVQPQTVQPVASTKLF
jgi:hypothetical protein